MSTVSQVRTFPYYGGKSGANPLNPWIRARLWPGARTYVEPFAGMCGILTSRPRAHREVINDMDGNVVNMWASLRAEPKELQRLLTVTEYSLDAWRESLGMLDTTAYPYPSVRRAAAFLTLLIMGHGSVPRVGRAGFTRPLLAKTKMKQPHRYAEIIPELLRRMQGVEVCNEDAVQVASAFSRDSDVLMYVDPPYLNADSRYAYGAELDFDAMREALRGARAKVAISGYPGDPWDDLGWNRHELEVSKNVTRTIHGATRATECLWTNYPLPENVR